MLFFLYLQYLSKYQNILDSVAYRRMYWCYYGDVPFFFSCLSVTTIRLLEILLRLSTSRMVSGSKYYLIFGEREVVF